uniref:TBC1 domain family member 30-like n=1 Tax=Oncorhynchus gorbuscha TaxID=8017 RepID=UPI001EAF8532|nr:TBC1 domain family member 30-like [Oncorhynchus gorbuscha]
MADLSPGAVDGGGRAEHQAAINSMLQERMSTDISALKKQYSRIKRHQQQQARQLYIHTDRCPATSVLASQLHPSPVVNHLLLGRKPRNSLKHPPSSPSSLRGVPLPQAQSSPATPGPAPNPTPGPAPNPTPSGERGRIRLVSQAENCQSRVGSPWRAHVRAHRRNIARARVQLGFGDMEDRHPHQTEEDRHPHQTEEDRHPHQTEEDRHPHQTEEDRHPHQTEEDRHPHQTEEREGVGEGKADDDEGSHLPVSPAQASSKEVPAVVEEEEHLLSLELDSGSELNQTPPPLPSSPRETDPDTLPCSPRETDPDTLPCSPRETDPDTLPCSPRETDPDTLPSSPTIPELPVLPPLPRPPSSHHHHHQQSDPSISSQNIYCVRLSPGSPVTLSNPLPCYPH